MKELIVFLMPVLPEIAVLLSAIAALFAGLFSSRPYFSKIIVHRLIYTGLISAFVLLFIIKVPESGLYIEKPLFILDGYAVLIKKIILIAGFFSVAFASDWLQYKKYFRFEAAVLIAFSIFGMMLTVSAGSFLSQFLGLEVMQAPLLFLVAYKRRGERSTEAGAKYVITALLGSALYLFGVSVIYACLGTVDFPLIALANKKDVLMPLLWGISFMTAGFFLKIGIVPFHAWLSDVYEGAPAPFTAFFGSVVRLPLLTAFARVVLGPFESLSFFWIPVLSFAVIASVCIGAFGAMIQTNIKRLAAYTVLVSSGFALSALIAGNAPSLLFFLVVDTFLMLGLFSIMLSLRVGGDLYEDLQALVGQGNAKPVRGALFSLVFLGITGLPPFGGFWSRFFLFEKNIQTGHLSLVILLLLGSILLAYVYLKQIRLMYFSSAKEELLPAPKAMKFAMWFAVLVSVLLVAFVEPLWQVVLNAVLVNG